MGDIAKMIATGRIVADPEARGSIAAFTIAVNRYIPRGKEGQATFIACAAQGKAGELILANEHMVKGRQVLVSGDYVQKDWMGKDGGRRQGYTLWLQGVPELIGAKPEAGDKHVDDGIPDEFGDVVVRDIEF